MLCLKPSAFAAKALSKVKVIFLRARLKKPLRASRVRIRAKVKPETIIAVLTNQDKEGAKCLCATLGLDPWPPSIEGYTGTVLTPKDEGLLVVAHSCLRSSQVRVAKFKLWLVIVKQAPSAYTFSCTF